MHWVYLSPHFDDAALSCGGLAWEQVQAGDTVSIWTACAGEPPAGELSPFAGELQARWKTGRDAPVDRRLEDLDSCRCLGAGRVYFTIPDCIYRRHPQTGEFLYASEAALNGPLHPGDAETISALQGQVKQLLAHGLRIVVPLGLGNHVDHQLTRLALEGLGFPTWYYQDFPYVLRCPVQVRQLESNGWESRLFTVSQAGLLAWQDSVAAHASQISTFWSGEIEMRGAIADYFRMTGGIRLWRKRLGK